MHAGPGIVLVANDANVSIDESENRRGLLFSQKSPMTGSNPENLRTVFEAALVNCRKIEDESALRGRLRFTANETLVSLNDRMLGSNSQEYFGALVREVEPLAKQLYGRSGIDFERDADPRRRLSLRIKSSGAIDVREALANLLRH
jgi:hypothetical protein